MTNVSKAMEYAAAFEREAMHERLDALGDLDHMNLIQIEEMVLNHRQQIKDLAAHLLELKQSMPTVKKSLKVQARKWVGLTDDEIEHLRNDQPWWMVRDIEAKLREKNGG